MLSRVHISLDLASKIADGAVDFAKSKNFKPVTVVVVDQSANVIVQKRMDNCSSAGIPQYAYAKAYTCVSMSMSSRTFRDRYASSSNPLDPGKFGQMVAMVNISEGKMAPFPGGILLRSKSTGEIVGAVGVSGAASDEDESCALNGAALVAEFLTTV